MDARIYQPSKSATQSGRARTRRWVLEHLHGKPKFRDPLMGWTGSADTVQQVKLSFSSREEAVAYASRNGLKVIVEEPKRPRTLKKNYADNFKFERVR